MISKDRHEHSGSSSSGMVDPERVLSMIDLAEGDSVLDLGCSSGDYSMSASRIVGEYGRVISLDQHEPSIQELESKIGKESADNVRPILADMTKGIPVEDGSIDVVFLFNVLHGLVYNDELDPVMKELKRIMKKSSRLSIMEFKKGIEGKGPPDSVRLTQSRIVKMLGQYGFIHCDTYDAGDHHFLMIMMI